MVHNVKGLTCSKDFCGRDECWIKTRPVVWHPFVFRIWICPLVDTPGYLNMMCEPGQT